jgi:serine/threonine-protein kinase
LHITRFCGAGGSGVAYLANDTQLHRPVVLKMLHTGLLTAEQMRSTVLREARMASARRIRRSKQTSFLAA